jgi:4-amino-4-deoxy-L-arabinose transferase-like glycosyltransferase
VLALYLALRVLGWAGTTLLEDHDSAGYMYEARQYLTFDPARFLNLGPDSNPVYPILTALASLPGWGVESGARLVSFLSSVGLFAALLAIGRRWGSRDGAALGLLCVALSPVLIGLSFAVLSEPIYIAIVYVGLALLLGWYDRPSPARGAALGLVFGLAFLTRTEGVLFAAFVPLIQALHFAFGRSRSYGSRQLVRWAVAFAGVFAVVAAPQIWNVSRQAGRLLLNGRQTWGVILKAGPDRPYDERLYSLDHRPDSVNIDYLLAHPEAVPAAPAGTRLGTHVKVALGNFDQLNQSVFGRLIGPVGLMLFGVGLIGLSLTRPRFELLVLAGFVAVTLAGPLWHNVVLRHVAVLAPLIWLVAGFGIAEAAERMRRRKVGRPFSPALVKAVSVGGVALVGLVPLREVLRPPDCNTHYCAASLAAPVKILHDFERETGRPAVVATRRFYLTAMAASGQVTLPYTELPGLVRYLELRRADFVFLDEAGAGRFPFYPDFADGEAPAGFVSVYRAKDAWGRQLELFRFIPAEAKPAGDGAAR